MKQLVKEPSGAPSRYATCEWFYHTPLKQTEAAREVALPPTSQIPGLSDLAEPHNESSTDKRRKWIRDTDSDYVKLAKQGGRPDLLKQITTTPKKTSPVSYAVPDWYTHENLTPTPEHTEAPLRNIPDYMVHEEFNTEENDQKYEGKRGPFDFDQKTVWQRESEDPEKENNIEKKVKLPAIKPRFMNDNNITLSDKGPPSTKLKEEKLGKKCFFPPMPGSKNNEAVSFSKLLSNGYGDDWFQQRSDLEKSLQKSKIFKG
ncbi:uncharacterized protein C7orf57 homolog isoform 2-T2 [Rhinophrynus dorsalis]